jgi:formylglycine-generating enzyme required for sulfatase activity
MTTACKVGDMRHIKLFTEMLGCALVLILVAACSTVAPTPTRVPPSVAQAEPILTTVDTPPGAPTAAVAPTREATVTSEPPPESMGAATRVLEPSGITLVYVPGGEFTMGSVADDSTAHDHEKPAHTGYVDGYWIGQTEVTNEQYARFMEAGGYSRREYWTEQGWQWKEGTTP